MPRNLDRRVEVAFEIEDNKLKEKILEILDITLRDTAKARIQQADDIRYKRVDKRGKELLHSQPMFYELAKKYAEDFRKKKNKEIFVPVLGNKE